MQYLQTKIATQTSLTQKTAIGTSLALLGGLWAFMVFPFPVDTRCPSLLESICQSRADCQAIYDGSLNFVSCIALDADALRDLKQSSQLCELTGGAWQKTDYGSYCDCSSQGTIFNVTSGCQ